MSGNKWYAYVIPARHLGGITETWEECRRIVSGEAQARYKSFSRRDDAEHWLEHGGRYGQKQAARRGIYFDAGTGRGKGVEISVTDEEGKDLLEKVLSKKEINRWGKHWVAPESTNNYGELLACKYALEIALADNIKHIFGDSKLVIEYWSRGAIKKESVAAQTVQLAREVAKLRQEFEGGGGAMERISGSDNPADLGFHR